MNILFVGRLDEFKDPILFVQAGVLSQCHNFIIAGDGKLKEECLKIIKEKDTKNIEMLGWISPAKVTELMEQSDIFCQLSPIENIWAATLIEAMKKKKAIICTDAGFTSTYLKHKQHVYLVRPRNVNDIVIAIKELCDDPVLRERIGENAYEFVMQHMTIRKITEEILSFIKEIVEEVG
jgi:glycosyltransferase involved in cell wall biosynthesis